MNGLAEGWGSTAANDPAKAACSLLTKIYTQLRPDQAGEVQRLALTMLDATPRGRLGDLYIALAQATSQAGAPADGGAELAATLLRNLEPARTAPTVPNYTEHLSIALAACAERANADVKVRVMSALEREARAGRWSAVTILANRGIELSPDLADTYLEQMIRRVVGLTAPSAPITFGLASSDLAALK